MWIHDTLCFFFFLGGGVELIEILKVCIFKQYFPGVVRFPWSF